MAAWDMGKPRFNPFKAKQLEEYGEEGIEYCESSVLIKKYVQRKEVESATSAATYKGKLWRFALFVYTHYDKVPFDSFMEQIREGKQDPYDVLADYASYLKKEKNTKPNEMRQKVHRVYKFLRFCKVKINREDFHENVSLPKQEFPDFEGLEKQQIVELLNSCEGLPRLKTAIILFGAMGCRAIEGCAVRNCDIDFDKQQITFRKEYTKTKVERTRPMTNELKKQS